MAYPLRAKDAHAADALTDVLSTHTYLGSWYNNATFLFPALAALGTLIAWGIFGSLELIGISIFFFVVTGVMFPLVVFTWQRTTTAVVVHQAGILALHQGLTVQSLAWSDVHAVRRVETMGNVRWYIVGPDGDHLTIEGEIDEHDALLETACRLSGNDLETT